MLTIFANIQDIRQDFFAQVRERSNNYMTERDFRNWLFNSVNFLGLIYTDFQFGGNSDIRFSEPVTAFDALNDLYVQLRDLLYYPELENREVSKCSGFLNGDMLYFHVEFTDE